MLQQTNDRSLYSFKSRFHCNNKKYVPESVRIQAIDRGTGRAKGGSCPHPTFLSGGASNAVCPPPLFHVHIYIFIVIFFTFALNFGFFLYAK